MSKQTTTEQPEKRSTFGPSHLEVIIIALLTTLVAIVGYDKLFAQKIKILDLQGYLRTQKARLAAGEITEQQWTRKLDTIEQVLNDEATSHQNHIIVLKDVVLRNGDEIRIEK